MCRPRHADWLLYALLLSIILQVVKEPIQLKLVPGGLYQLLCSPPGQPQEEYVLDPQDWDLRPASLDEITATVSTARAYSNGSSS